MNALYGNREAMDCWERMDTLSDCFAAVTALMNPEPDLANVNREKLGLLLYFLTDEYEKAKQGFTQALG